MAYLNVNSSNNKVIKLIHHKRYKEPQETTKPFKQVANASDSIIDFLSVKSKRDQEKSIREQLNKFMNEIYPHMTRDDFEKLTNIRDDSNDVISHELAKITTRIELEKLLEQE